MMYSTMSIMGLYDHDNTIFDNFMLPAAIDKDTLLENLLIELADLEILYPNPNTMKVAIGAWSKTRVDSWNRMIEAFDAQYNPIHNFDRNEEWNDSGSASNEASSLQKVAGYNQTGSLTDRNSATQTGSGNSASTHKGHLFGNIGVTTTQEMIDAEMELRKKDMYSTIIREFQDKFCLLVY